LIELELAHNRLNGGLEPLQGCAALRELYLSHNQLSGSLEPIQSCTALQYIHLSSNQLNMGDEVRAHFEKQGQLFRI